MRLGADIVGLLDKHAPIGVGYGKFHERNIEMIQSLAREQRHCDRVKMKCLIDEAEVFEPMPKVNVGYVAQQDPTLLGGRFSISVLTDAIKDARLS